MPKKQSNLLVITKTKDLARDGSKALIISRYALDAKPFNTKYRDVTWETCALREWLNGEFLNRAFSAAERNAIQTTAVDNSGSQGYSGYSTKGGNGTQDKIFLLSDAEAWQYFKTDSERRCAPTDYAIEQGAMTTFYAKAEGRAASWWWLRSPGGAQRSATLVRSDGSRYYCDVDLKAYVVRPALWVDIDL